MRKRILISLAIVLPLGLILAFSINNSKEEVQKELYLTDLVVSSLKYVHYEHRAMDDEFSKKVFSLFIERLDYTKKFLLKSDMDKLRAYETEIDNEIEGRTQEFFDASYSLIAQRTKDAEAYYSDILDKPFDFTKKENIQLDDEKNIWATNEDDLKDMWRKSLKYQVMLRISSKLKSQEKALEKNDTSVVQKSFNELEEDARAKVLKQNKDYFRRLGQLERKDYFALYLNAINGSYDPHTSYYPPKVKEDFDIRMSGQLEGIGATLQEKDGYIKVVNIVPGSPSWKQGDLKAGDLILKVAQGDDEPLDLIGMRLDKAVKFIRGKKGTTVKLTVKKVDGTITVISIVRDVVIIEATYAKSVIVSVKDSKKRIGYIYLPSFYVNFNEKGGGRRSADDVLKEINKLKAEGVDGMIIDLRNDGGGSLQDVVTMGGYFIEKGPIVQVKQKGKKAQSMDDTDATIQYDGPLAIMVNSNSASASEIFAAAMQDYKRAIIIGGKQTFGKGTVQRFIDLDRFAPDQMNHFKPFGAEKLTIQKFYRINGGATQLKGVAPDVVLPDNFMFIKYGEHELDNFLPWDEIEPVKYIEVANQSDFDKVIKTSNDRVANSEKFRLKKEQAKRVKRMRNQTVHSLNFKEFQSNELKLEAESKKFKGIMKDTTAVIVRPLKVDMNIYLMDTVKTEVAEKWHRSLTKDIYLQEAIKVVNDIK
ncbi:MAG: carboxy terminal-processing peptidase [Bacteroidales bacterium]|nr:carboxy terminal-processing peptidase [Bacteroidales bacterium]